MKASELKNAIRLLKEAEVEIDDNLLWSVKATIIYVRQLLEVDAE